MNFESRGYKHWDTRHNALGVTKYYQRRVDTDEGFDLPLCHCNEKLYINIEHSDFNINGTNHNSCEISLTHENNEGKWCDLKIYSLKEYDLLDNLDKYEAKLLAMWKVFNE